MFAVLMAVGLTVAGCSDDEPGSISDGPETPGATTSTTLIDETSSSPPISPTATEPASPPPTDTSTTTEPTSDGERLVIERYEAFWTARAQANAEPPNPDDPRLRELATGPQLLTVVAETEDRRAQGLAIRFPDRSVSTMRVRVRSVEADRAVLQECSVDDGIIYRPATGEVVNAETVSRSAEATMRRIDGVWRVETTRVLQQWKGVAGCALADDL